MSGQVTARVLDEILHLGDRRSSIRMAIEREIHYKVLGRRKGIVKQAGSGRTVNISSGGMLFTTEATIAAGERVEVSVSWPAKLRGVTPLKLVALGHVVRRDEREAAIVIEKHEFKPVGIRGL
jgi:hypothetical protein